jgi:hypothetical protein
MFDEAEKRLNERVQILDEIQKPFVDTQCQLWAGPVSKHGYGHINIYGKKIATHILACEIKEGKHRPIDLVTRHLCGNKLCCNPDHLEFGTFQDNSIDNVKHGKSQAKLTEEIVREIRQTLGKDNLTKKQRANKYGISVTNLSYVEKNRIWKHVK